MSIPASVVEQTREIDLEFLREKYRIERDRRLRPDGEAQYLEVSGKYAHYGEDDPYTPELVERAPLADEVEVLIVGGGFGGVTAAARLKQAGIEDVRIVEAGGDFGGTWYWNRYPGCQCDVDSYIYLPLLEETNYIPSMKYVYAPEIYEHVRRIANTFGLYEKAVFQTRVRGMEWSDDQGRWLVDTNRGDKMKARFVIVIPGAHPRPKLPRIAGIDDFKGKMFHTSRWDYEYTGGNNQGKLNKLADKKVAIIGTGATAVQCVPFLGESAEHLYVFQRTPSSLGPRENSPTDPDWAASLKPGWQAERMRNFEDVVAGKPVPNMVNDAFTQIFVSLGALVPSEGLEQLTPEDFGLLMELADAKAMNAKRSFVDQQVNDPKIAELLKPWFRLMCKRPTYNDDYLATFNRPNVTLVDTSPCHGVERLTEKGVVANGVEYEVDCIIFSTGYESSTSYRRRFGFEIRGRDGQSLFDHWGQGMRTFHGWGIHGFPNFFYNGVTQGSISPNYTSTVTLQATHAAAVIKSALDRGASYVEPTAEAEQGWVDEIERLRNPGLKEFFDSCTPGYFNNEGQKNPEGEATTMIAYPPGHNAFDDLLKAWRDSGTLDGLTVR